MTDQPAVLFVCLGNICRSPLAEGAFRLAAGKAGLAVQIDSAGIGNWHVGNPPDPRAQAVAARMGTDISDLRARQIHKDDFQRFTHIIAMDHANLRALRAMQPEGARAEVSLLLDHVPGRAGQEIADPYYGGAEGFQTAWADVTAGADSLLGRLLPRN